jgi:putative pyruvate formate lyase activating enzyme
MSEFCNICPRKCNVLRPKLREDGVSIPGLCGLPMHPVVARAGLHFWEEPVISGTKGSGTVFFQRMQSAVCILPEL